VCVCVCLRELVSKSEHEQERAKVRAMCVIVFDYFNPISPFLLPPLHHMVTSPSHTHRQTDRQTDRQTAPIYRQRDRQTDRQHPSTDRQTDRQLPSTDRQTDRQTESSHLHSVHIKEIRTSAVCTSPPHHWGAPRLGDGTTSLCHLHHLVGPYHPLAWFFLPLLCRLYSS